MACLGRGPSAVSGTAQSARGCLSAMGVDRRHRAARFSPDSEFSAVRRRKLVTCGISSARDRKSVFASKPTRVEWRCTMNDIVTERSGSILRIQLNRPSRKNAMTSAMYVGLADLLNQALSDDGIRAVLWHGAGDSFCAGNDVEDFLKNPPTPGETPQSLLMKAFLSFDKPLIAAVQGFAVGG